MLTGAREVMQSLLFLCSLQALFIPCLGARGVIRGIGGGGEPGILPITRHGIVDMYLFNPNYPGGGAQLSSAVGKSRFLRN